MLFACSRLGFTMHMAYPMLEHGDAQGAGIKIASSMAASQTATPSSLRLTLDPTVLASCAPHAAIVH